MALGNSSAWGSAARGLGRPGVRFLRPGPSEVVALRRREVELTVERPLAPGPGAGSVRLSARFEPSGESGPTPQELSEALDRLRADLDALVGPPLAAAGVLRPERDLVELVHAYRPRQRELVDLLRDEGEISLAEHTQLAEYLARGAAGVRSEPPSRPAFFDQPIAAAPILAERGGEGARPVPELLRTYRIETLKQAGAVRARRQISFAEYMALKRHFEPATSEASASTPAP